MSRPLKITAFILVQLVAVLLILEIGLRILRPIHPGIRVLTYVPSAHTKYDRITSTQRLLETSILGFSPRRAQSGFVLNSRGFRTREYDDHKPPGVIRILAIGDSFTFSSGQLPHSRMWHTRLEERLNGAGAPNVEVLNLGVPAVGPRFELRLWELEGARLAPDIVILAFFVGNDFRDGVGADREETLDRLMAWSLTARVVRNVTKIRGEQLGAALGQPEGESSDEAIGGVEIETIDVYEARFRETRRVMTERQHVRIQAQHLVLSQPERLGELEVLVEQLEPILERFATGVRLAGGRPLVMIIPEEFQVNRKVLKRAAQHARYRGEIDIEQPQRLLKEVLERHQIEYLDLLPSFRREGETRRLYGPLNTHWNVRGNRLAATELANFLWDGRWLSPRD